MTRLTLTALTLTLSLAFAACDRKPAPPKADTIDQLVRKGDGSSLFINGGPTSVEVQAYGTPLESKGRYGPEGTVVFPVRVRVRERNGANYTSDYFFWKNPYGEWQLAHDRGK